MLIPENIKENEGSGKKNTNNQNILKQKNYDWSNNNTDNRNTRHGNPA